VEITPGQRWIRNRDGAQIVIEARSALMFRWWRVRSVDSDLPSAIDERSILAGYHLAPSEEQGRADDERQLAERLLSGCAATT
jgi:hypothetical protein